MLIYGYAFGNTQVVINEFHSSIDDTFLEVSFPTDHTVGKMDGTGILILNAKTANKKKTEYIMKAAIDLKGISVPDGQSVGVIKLKNKDGSKPEPSNVLPLEMGKNFRHFGLPHQWLEVDTDSLLIIIVVQSGNNLFSTPEFASFFPPLRKLGNQHQQFIKLHWKDALIVRGMNGPVKCSTLNDLFGMSPNDEFLTATPDYSLNRCGYGNRDPMNLRIYKHGAPSPGKLS